MIVPDWADVTKPVRKSMWCLFFLSVSTLSKVRRRLQISVLSKYSFMKVSLRGLNSMIWLLQRSDNFLLRCFFLVRLILAGMQKVAVWIILVFFGFFSIFSVMRAPLAYNRVVCLFYLLLNQLFMVVTVRTILLDIIWSGEQRNWSGKLLLGCLPHRSWLVLHCRESWVCYLDRLEELTLIWVGKCV